ncbi:MAG: alpha/beta hydrolase [Acidobacteria bacterium]|nr:MAG: alpha/beta hydrolase [Acidobacteriota bacterium]
MSPDSSEFVNETVDPPIRGFLHTPDTPTAEVLILTHGAGGNAQAPLLRALADAFSNAGITVLRCNLPYRQLRPFGPPGPGDAARDRAGLKNAVAAMASAMNAGGNASAPSRIYLAGHSYGGRQSSMLCAEEPDLVAGLLLLSYPLHPPRKPEQQRTQHLPDLHTRTLFVQGTRDPFASIPELQQALKMIPAKTKLLPVEGAGHDLGFKGKATRAELPQIILSESQQLFGR